MTFLVSLKKIVFILKDMEFVLIEKLKMVKKFTLIKSFNVSLCIYGGLYSYFHILLSNDKQKQENLIYRTEI